MAAAQGRNGGQGSDVMSMTMEERLALNKYDVDSQAHIRLNEDLCSECQPRVCLHVCPAECFKLREGRVTFAYEGCLECGSCWQVCDFNAINFSYPKGGTGVVFRRG